MVNLGCKVNRVESDDFAATLIVGGGREVPIEAADFIVVNTCTVTGEAEKKTRKAVRQALRANDFARVVVTGCAAAIDPITYTEMDPRVEVVPKGAMADVLGSQASTSPALAAIRAGEEFPTRVGVKVQDGCNNACTYCIVHDARGRATSRPSEEIIAEVRELARAGVREIVLTGINLGSYREGDMRLADLLRCLMKAVDEEFPADSGLGVVPRVRFRVSSIEPRDVDDDLIELMAASNAAFAAICICRCNRVRARCCAKCDAPIAPSDFWAWSRSCMRPCRSYRFRPTLLWVSLAKLKKTSLRHAVWLRHAVFRRCTSSAIRSVRERLRPSVTIRSRPR